MCAVRLPTILTTRGGQDEDHFAVPGTTILQSGVPRIPYLPSRDREGVFYLADEALHALPPGFFFWEAAVQSVLGPGYASARMAALLNGAMLLFVAFEFAGRRAGPAAGLWTVALLGLSRPFVFQAQLARPDLQCAAFALAAIAVADLFSWRRPALVGVLLGCAALSHPFALAAGVVLGFSAMGTPGPRGGRLLKFGAACAAALAPWGLLIARNPEAFWFQFRNNVLSRAGPGLMTRLFDPRDTLATQGRQLVEHCGILLLAMLALGLAMARRTRAGRRFLGWTVGVFIALWWLLGTHPAKGYWVLPAALACAACGASIGALFARERRLLGWAAGFAALACCLPGGGWRTTWNHLRHWGEADFDHRKTIARALADIPANARLLADQGCVLDAWIAGRNVLLALDRPGCFDSRGTRADFLILTGAAKDVGLAPAAFGMRRRVGSYGRADVPDTTFVEVWAP